MEPAELSTMLKRFYAEARNVSGVATLWKPIRSGLDNFYLVPFKESRLFSSIRERAFKPANVVLDPSLKDPARQGLIKLRKAPASNFQLRPWSPLCSESAWSEYSRKSCKFGFTPIYFGKRGRENQRAMKPVGDLQLKTTASGLKCLVLSFPASRSLSRRGKMKREERDLCRLPTSCLMKPPTKFLVETYRFSKPVSFNV